MLPKYATLKERTEEFLDIITVDVPKDKVALEKLKKKTKYVENNMVILARYRDGIEEGKYSINDNILRLLTKQSTRSISGITAITILLKPWPCQADCVYCPTEARMPKSYLSGEPGVMRAILNRWDAKKQVKTRVKALQLMGHDTSKNELIILGGTWQNYPKKYREEFVQRMYEGLNDMPADSLEDAQKQNEKTANRCIGLSLETRPDCVTRDEVRHMRSLGATKIELGVQTVYEEVSDVMKRGHGMQEVYDATKMLRDAGFKIHYHIMPNLPGATLEKDEKMFDILFDHPGLKPDMLKVYPTVVVNHSELKQWAAEGRHKAYDDLDLIELLTKCVMKVKRYCRIMRLGRDIPAYDISEGNTLTNIREYVDKSLVKKKFIPEEIRAREVGFRTPEQGVDPELKVTEYEAADGQEYFIEFYDAQTDALYGFTRLRIPSQHWSGESHWMPELEGCALIRELHVYGRVVGVGGDGVVGRSQHRGLGQRLLSKAAQISREKYDIKKLAVISGIGVKDYYKGLGYQEVGLYMIKDLVKE